MHNHDGAAKREPLASRIRDAMIADEAEDGYAI